MIDPTSAMSRLRRFHIQLEGAMAADKPPRGYELRESTSRPGFLQVLLNGQEELLVQDHFDKRVRAFAPLWLESTLKELRYTVRGTHGGATIVDAPDGEAWAIALQFDDDPVPDERLCREAAAANAKAAFVDARSIDDPEATRRSFQPVKCPPPTPGTASD